MKAQRLQAQFIRKREIQQQNVEKTKGRNEPRFGGKTTNKFSSSRNVYCLDYLFISKSGQYLVNIFVSSFPGGNFKIVFSKDSDEGNKKLRCN
jgi:hypothetical protein